MLLPKRFADSFRKKSLEEGKICHYKICDVKHNIYIYIYIYVVIESNCSMLQFQTNTKFNEEDYDDGRIPLHTFEFVSFDHLEARIGKDTHVDLSSYIIKYHVIKKHDIYHFVYSFLRYQILCRQSHLLLREISTSK